MTEKEAPYFSVVIATYNASETLQDCLDSVIFQTGAKVEVIIIDGNSSDNTVEVIESNSVHISYWISEPDSGIYSAWNKALPMCRGEWVIFLGADDTLRDPEVLLNAEHALKLLTPEIILAYGALMMVNASGKDVSLHGEVPVPLAKALKTGMAVPHTSLFHRLSSFVELGNFDESFRIAGDYEFVLRANTAQIVQLSPPVLVSNMRLGGLSSSSKQRMLTIKEFRRAQILNGQRLPTAKWVVSFVSALLIQATFKVFDKEKTSRMLDNIRAVFGKPPYWTEL